MVVFLFVGVKGWFFVCRSEMVVFLFVGVREWSFCL